MNEANEVKTVKTVKVKCSFCGEETNCPESMAKTIEREAGKHVCEFCSEAFSHGATEESVAVESKAERALSGYYGDVDALAGLIEFTSFEAFKIPRQAAKTMGKEEVARAMFNAGAVSALDVVLHYSSAESLRECKEKFFEKCKERLFDKLVEEGWKEEDARKASDAIVLIGSGDVGEKEFRRVLEELAAKAEARAEAKGCG